MEMVQGNDAAKQLFAFQSKSQARSIISTFLSNAQDIEEILKIVEDENITGF
jgi:D-arabinose 1-dehydrogenase-like Zn-dependent alcohol dehydrogenase